MVYKTMTEIAREANNQIVYVPYNREKYLGNDKLVSTVLGNRGISGKFFSSLGIVLAIGITSGLINFASQMYTGKPLIPKIVNGLESYLESQD